MFHLTRLSHLLRGLLAIILLAVTLSGAVYADVGPQPILPGGSNLQPEGETSIQMSAEKVVMNVRDATEADNTIVDLNPHIYGFDYHPVWYSAIAEVDADFTMKNPSTENVSMIVWFPLASAMENVSWNLRIDETVPRIEQFQVKVNGEAIEYEVSELPNPKGADKPKLPWASFPVDFPAGEGTLIHISYSLPLQPTAKGNEVVLYYIFQTGAGWAGTIGQAEMIVNLPYPASDATVSGKLSPSLAAGSVQRGWTELPAGAVMTGNQIRWTWKNFEPGPEDDLAILLLKPDKWSQIESAQAAVKAQPENGDAWLDLAFIYHSLSAYRMTNLPLIFSSSYISKGIEAYQKAAGLLPDDPAPHIGLGLLTLTPYMHEKNAPSSVIQFVQNELQTARDLESRESPPENDWGLSSSDLQDALDYYFYNEATATVQAKTQAVYNLTYTAEATRNYATLTLWAQGKADALACMNNTGVACTPTPGLTETPQPQGTPAAAAQENKFLSQFMAFLLILLFVGLTLAGYAIRKKIKRKVEQ